MLSGMCHMEGWDRYRLGHPAVEVLAEAPRLNIQSGTVRSYTKDRAVLRWDYTLKRGRYKVDKKPTHRNTSCGNLRRPHRTKTSTVWCCLLLRVAAFLASKYTGRPCTSFVVERVPPQGAPYKGGPHRVSKKSADFRCRKRTLWTYEMLLLYCRGRSLSGRQVLTTFLGPV